MLLWLWVLTWIAVAGMTVLALLRPHLKAAWWIALGGAWLLALLWAAAYPSTPRVGLWPGLWSPVQPPPGSQFTSWTWAAGLVVLVAAWAGLALAAHRLPAALVTDPRPWAAWLLLAMLGLTGVTATAGWANALAWAVIDGAVLAVEWHTRPTPQARYHAARRTGVRALFWMVPIAAHALPKAWTAPVWAVALLGRALAAPQVPSSTDAVFAHTGRWIWWLPWMVSWAPWLHARPAALSAPAALVVAAIGIGAGFRAVWRNDETLPSGGWLTAVSALLLLAAPVHLEAARAWWLLLTVGGLSLELLRMSPNPWLAGGWAVVMAAPALLAPFTPAAVALAAWPWPPTPVTGALILLYALLLAAAWRQWPRGGDALANAPRGAQVLVATGIFALPAVLWGVGLRLGWITPPGNLPGWLPWGAGPVVAGGGFLIASLRRKSGPRANRQRRGLLAAGGRALRALVRSWGQGLENAILFTTSLLEGEGGVFWALVALALGLLWWKGG